MKVSYNWLKEYVSFNESPQELADKLTEAGFEVEEMYPLYPEFSGVVVGHVQKVQKHPNADKLSLCEVSDGNSAYQVICGAPNVQPGQTVPFAKVGAILPGGFKIKKAKIRGVESLGMICSKEELGLAKSSDGIWPLENGFKLGEDFYKQLASEQDYIYDFFITPNRPDCLSTFGMAREVAAITGNELVYPEITLVEDNDKSAAELVSIEIEDEIGCPRYTGRIIESVEIGESPEWMQKKLETVGMRPINNIVDITNYVLMELGHPLHAFDLNEVCQNKILVRESSKDEKFTTLDEKQHTLPAQTVMICDGERPVAIGGIMGGLNSEVTEKTTDILLESAYFKPERIAVSAKKLNISSEASHRFERGTDPNGVTQALDRAAALIAELAGGKVLKGIVDVYPKRIQPKSITLRPERVNRVLGSKLSDSTIFDKLKSIGLKVEGSDIEIPTFRVDLKKEIDLIEEIARLVNFANLPATDSSNVRYEFQQAGIETIQNKFRSTLIELGLQEVVTNGMIKKSEALLFHDTGKPIEIINPISDDMVVMRPSLLPGMLKVVNYNLNRNNANLHLFEIGRIFTDYQENKLPKQPLAIAAMLAGTRYSEQWNQDKISLDFYDIKGFLETFLAKILLDNFQFIIYDKAKHFEPEETIAVQVGEEIIGYCGRLSSEIASSFDIDNPVFAFELILDDALYKVRFEKQYKPVPKYPYVEKDLAFILDQDLTSAELLDAVRKIAGILLERVDVFDMFSGKSVPEGKKSLAIRMRFQSPDRTLSDDEVDVIFKQIIEHVNKKFNATLRN